VAAPTVLASRRRAGTDACHEPSGQAGAADVKEAGHENILRPRTPPSQSLVAVSIRAFAGAAAAGRSRWTGRDWGAPTRSSVSGGARIVLSVMARLEDRLLNHPVHGSINELRATVAGLDDDTVDVANEVSAGALDRVPEALTYIEGALAAAAPGLVTSSALEAINSAITNANQTATNIVSNPAVTTTFETYIEAALDAVVPVVAASPLIADKSNRAAKRFSTALTETVKAATEEVEAPSAQTALI